MSERPRTATEDEIRDALARLTDTGRLRLKMYADRRIRVLGRLAAGHTGLDLIQEAVALTLSGERTWPIDKVSFVGHLMGVIKSYTSHLHERAETEKHDEPYLESEVLTTDEEGREINPMAQATRAAWTPSPFLDGRCDWAEAEQILARAFSHFEKDEEASEMLLHMLEGKKGPAIQAEMRISATQYATIHRRITRELPKVLSDGE